MYVIVQENKPFATHDAISGIRTRWITLYPQAQALLSIDAEINLTDISPKTMEELIGMGAVVIEQLSSDPVSAARERSTKRCYEIARERLDAATIDYSSSEMAVWEKLDTEARAFQANGTIGKRMKSQVDRGVRSAADIAAAVIANANSLEIYRAAVVEYRAARVAEVQAAADPATVDVESGWPMPAGS